MWRRSAATATNTPDMPYIGSLIMTAGDLRDFMVHFVNALPNPVFIKDDRHRIVFFNDAFGAMLGRSRDELVGKSDFDLVPAEEARIYWDKDDKVFRTGQPDENEEALTDAAGVRHWLLTRKSLVTLPDGRRYLLGVILDITERKRAEERLVDAIETMSEGFVLFDATDRLVLCNSRYKELYRDSAHAIDPGARFEDMLRAGLAHGQYPDAIGRGEEWLAERLAAHRSGQNHFDQRLPNGRWVHVVTRRTADGGTVGVRFDVTERKRREAELRKAKEEAEASNRAKSDFLSNMSHELRTPLNAILGFAEVLTLGTAGPLDPKQAEYVNDIHRSGLLLLDLINDVLDLSKVDAGALALREEVTQLEEVLEVCERLIRGRAEKGGIRLNFECDPELEPIVVDRIRLKQILLNLLSNAVKFTPPGGDVRLSVTQTAAEVVFVVADTGIGMRPEDVPVALNPFQQMDGAFVRQHEGAGLGLPLAKRLVELHGGVLEIASEPGKGTRATVRLPMQRPSMLDRVAHAASVPPFEPSPDSDDSAASTPFEATPAVGSHITRSGSSTLDWQRIADWTDGIAAGEIDEVARVFAGEDLSAPVVRWSPREDDLPVEPLRLLLAYWTGLRGDAAVPHHQDIDPVAMRAALGFVMLLEPVDEDRDFRYRLYGSTIARVSGFDMTGRLMSSHPASAYAVELAVASTRACLRRRLPLFTERQPAQAEKTTRWPRLVLPLSDNSGRVVRILAGTVPVGRDGRAIVA